MLYRIILTVTIGFWAERLGLKGLKLLGACFS